MTTPWIRPATLDEALAVREEHADWRVLAGGTDLMVDAGRRPAPAGVIDLFGLPGLVGVEPMRDGSLRIGAATTYSMLLASDDVRRHLPLLAAVAREVGAWQIQARGTLGGNVGTCSPVGDTLPALLALDAEVELVSRKGVRLVAFDDFCTGYRTTDLRPGELIAALRFGRRALFASEGARHAWRKVGTRRAQSVSKVMLAAVAVLDDERRITCARLGLGAVRERPVRARAAEDLLVGERADAALAQRASEALTHDIAPIDDVRSTAAYRRDVAARLVRRFVLSLA
ncbi:MAG: xanthine dehydrogenase family protein subunit M [Planctomycetes bacterium]|nr:xanthine dehydrogenase family protein subunit M [Planctomycetota bacterium]